MYKTLIFFLGLLLFNTSLRAQSPVTPISIDYITYEGERNELLEGLIDILDVRYMILQIKGDLSGKSFSLVQHVVKDNQLESTPIPMSFSTQDSLITGTIMTARQSNDTIKMSLVFKGHFHFAQLYPVKNNRSHILMETFLKETPENNLPLFGYTPGIAKEMEYEGQKGTWIDYCGLRDAKVSPEKWGEKYNIPDYIYFTLTVE